MRPKFVLFVVLAFVVMVVAVVLRPSKPLPQSQTVVPPVAVAAAAPQDNLPPPLPLPAPVAVVTPPPTPEECQAAIDAEIDRLQEWEKNDDAQSLSNILADLTNPEKAIREAAIEAAKQFSSTNAIPALKAAALSNPDSEEQMEMLEAANFLTLTPISDPSLQAPKTPEEAQSAAQQQARELAYQQALAQQQAQTQGQQPNASPTPSQGTGN